jgi:hypothetical protein
MSNQDLQDLFQGGAAEPVDATTEATNAVINALASVFPEYDTPPPPPPMAVKGPAKEKRPRGKEGPEISKPGNPTKRGATKDTGASEALEDIQRKKAEREAKKAAKEAAAAERKAKLLADGAAQAAAEEERAIGARKLEQARLQAIEYAARQAEFEAQRERAELEAAQKKGRASEREQEQEEPERRRKQAQTAVEDAVEEAVQAALPPTPAPAAPTITLGPTVDVPGKSTSAEAEERAYLERMEEQNRFQAEQGFSLSRTRPPVPPRSQKAAAAVAAAQQPTVETQAKVEDFMESLNERLQGMSKQTGAFEKKDTRTYRQRLQDSRKESREKEKLFRKEAFHTPGVMRDVAAQAAFRAQQLRKQNDYARVMYGQNVQQPQQARFVSSSIAPAGTVIKRENGQTISPQLQMHLSGILPDTTPVGEKRKLDLPDVLENKYIKQNPAEPRPMQMELSPATALTVSDPVAKVMSVPSAIAGCETTIPIAPTQWTALHKAAFETIQNALPRLSPAEKSEICEAFTRITHKKNGKGNKPKVPKLEALLRVSLRAGELEANRMRVAFGEQMRAFQKHRHGLVHHANGGYTAKMAGNPNRKVGVDVGARIPTRGALQRATGAIKRDVARKAIAATPLATAKQIAKASKPNKRVQLAAALLGNMGGGGGEAPAAAGVAGPPANQ